MKPCSCSDVVSEVEGTFYPCVSTEEHECEWNALVTETVVVSVWVS